MINEMFDDYLDGTLEDFGFALEIDRAVSTDPRAAKLMEKAWANRALRAAALASYTPSTEVAEAFAEQVITACREEAMAPVGRIAPQRRVRWLAGIAAGLILAVGAFTVGRMTVPPVEVVTVASGGDTTKTIVYSVAVIDRIMGDTQVHEFASADDRDTFIKEMTEHGNNVIAVAEYIPPGHM